jgi:hypothetical protein
LGSRNALIFSSGMSRWKKSKRFWSPKGIFFSEFMSKWLSGRPVSRICGGQTSFSSPKTLSRPTDGFKHLTRSYLVNGFIFILSSVFSVALAEISLGYFYPQPVSHQRLFCQYDPVLGWKHIPGATGRYRTAEYQTTEHFNSKGIRGPEVAYDKGENEYRVLILGDSFAEGYSVTFDRLFSQVLKRRLNGQSKKKVPAYEVINAGTGGWSTDQELLFFQGEGKKYRPDLTILFFYENDVWDNTQTRYWRGYKPLFKLAGEDLVLTHVPVPLPAAALKQTQTKAPFVARTRLAALFRRAVQNPRLSGRFSGRTGMAKTQRPDDEFRIFKKNLDPDYRNAWKLTERILIELKKETDTIGSRFLVFLVPDRSAIEPRVWKRALAQYGLDASEWDSTQVGNELKAICDRNRIDYLDPTNRFIDERRRNGQKEAYFPGDRHWNAVGHAIVANVLFDAILNNS